MLTKLIIRNFKKIESAEIDLGRTVVFVGPNNSGKTTALQALTLWQAAKDEWLSKRGGEAAPEKRPGITLNRKDLTSVPVPSSQMLWHELHVRDKKQGGTQNVRIEIVVEGVTKEKPWSCGFEFDYSNEESVVCRPAREQGFGGSPVKDSKFTQIPIEVEPTKVALLPPMSGLAADEPKLEPGRINVLIGQGQTAQVLRNLCYQVYETEPKNWDQIVETVKRFFGLKLTAPKFIVARGEVALSYESQAGGILDISSSGRGMQQTLLLLAYLYSKPNTVLLMDEPDAHLEIFRQRQLFNYITSLASKLGCQVIAASHSEVVLNEAADKHSVVAFVGKPHLLATQENKKQLRNALMDYGFEDYYQAERKGRVLYLEGSTDLAVLNEFARILKHPVAEKLEDCFVHYLGSNDVAISARHFNALKLASPDLRGYVLMDRMEGSPGLPSGLQFSSWMKREIENYFCSMDVLVKFASSGVDYDLFGPLLGHAEVERRVTIMRECISELEQALKTARRPGPWADDTKASDEFLGPLLENYYEKLGISDPLLKRDFYQLVKYCETKDLDPEVKQKLDQIFELLKDSDGQ